MMQHLEDELRRGGEQDEQLVEIKRFSREARETLEKEGYVIYRLTGQSIKSLRDAGRPFRSIWH